MATPWVLLFAVDGRVDLRHVNLIAGEQPGEFRHVMALWRSRSALLCTVRHNPGRYGPRLAGGNRHTVPSPCTFWRREDGDIGFLNIGKLRIQRGGNGRS